MCAANGEKHNTIINGFLRRFGVIFILILYLEIIFHVFSVGSQFLYLPLKLFFVLPTAVLLSIIPVFIPEKAGNIVEAVLIGLIIFYYCISLMYYDAFQVYFSVRLINATNTKIIQYYREIIDSLRANVIGLICMIVVPVGAYVFLRIRGFLRPKRVSPKLLFVPAACLFLSLLMCFGITLLYGKDYFSPYDLITNDHVLEYSFAKLGVLPTAEIEIKNLIFPKPMDEEEEFDVWVYEPVEEVVHKVKDENTISGEEKIEEAPENVVDRSPNIWDIDFVSLAENEANSEIAGIHKYFASVEPSNKNEYTGMFEGYNLIFLTAEAFCSLAVDEELTPTLYRLVNEGFVFNNFYNPRTSGSTSDGEFVCATSLVPTNGGATNYKICGRNSMPMGLGNMFNMKYGITSRAYHDGDYTYYDRHKTYPGMGYYYQGIGNGLKVSMHWPASDLEMVESTIDEYIDDDIFHVYYMTVSGHKNYSFGANYMSLKHKDEVADLPYSSACKAYIACQMELDRALEYLITRLEEKGIADRTVICFTGDHWPYGLTDEEYSEILGHDVEANFELYKSNLILWSGSIKEPIVVDKQCCSMDIAPTLLNLFGFDYDSRLLMGRDILSDTEGFVIFINRSFITDKVMFDSTNGKVTMLTDEELPEGYIDNCRSILNNRWKYSQKIMDYDYYKYICDYLNIEIPVVEQNYTY